MSLSGDESARRRVWAAFPPAAEAALRDGLSPTDLQTLLLDVARSRAAAVTPARLLRRWRDDRFVRPATSDPRALAAIEARLWALLPDHFAGLDLSPVAPLGTVSALCPLDQNRMLTTVRGSEAVSDPTNALALEAASRRREQNRNSTSGRARRIDLAATHRVVRGQLFTGPGEFAHFKLFALVSSARDRGSGLVEAELIVDHLRFYAAAIAAVAPGTAAGLTVSTFRRTAVDERLDDLLAELDRFGPAVVVRRDRKRTHGRGYYTSHALRIDLTTATGATANLGDGGLTDWTARLLGDAKERCLTSCISVERLAAAVD
jgi:hypothetical protein